MAANLLRRVGGVKSSPGIGRADQPIIFLGRQKHELALAAPRYLDRPSKRCLDDLAGSIAEVG
jgi:hypothetical protein